MDPELTEAAKEALNKIVDDVQKLNQQLQRFLKSMAESSRIQTAYKAPSMEERLERIMERLAKMTATQKSESDVAACVAIPEVAACGWDDPCDVEVKPTDSETSSQHLGIMYSSKSNNLIKSEVVVAASCKEIEKSDLVVDDQVSLLDLCPLPVCENAAVYLSSIPVAHKTFNANWCSMQVFYIAAVYLKPPWEPPDDRTRRELKLMSENDGIENISRVGKWKEAMSLLAKMEREDVFPDVVTYSSLINGLCQGGEFEKVKDVLCEMKGCGILTNLITSNSIIKGFCNVGNWKEADGIIREMKMSGVNPDVITYNSLIYGFSVNGKWEEARAAFVDMETNGVSPNVITYSSFINGFCNAGKLDKAKGIFCKMKGSGIIPNVMAYCSMISGLCDAGSWKEAETKKGVAITLESMLEIDTLDDYVAELEEEYKAWMIEAIDEDDHFVRISYLKGVELDELIGKVTISISFVPALGGYAFKDGYLPSPLDLSLMKEMSSTLHSEMFGELNEGYDIVHGMEELLVIWQHKPPPLPPENVLKTEGYDLLWSLSAATFLLTWLNKPPRPPEISGELISYIVYSSNVNGGLKSLLLSSSRIMVILVKVLCKRNNSKTILVIDLGAGICYVFVFETGKKMFEALSTLGDSQLDCDEFDKRIVDWLAKDFKQKCFTEVVEQRSSAMNKLKRITFQVTDEGLLDEDLTEWKDFIIHKHSGLFIGAYNHMSMINLGSSAYGESLDSGQSYDFNSIAVGSSLCRDLHIGKLATISDTIILTYKDVRRPMLVMPWTRDLWNRLALKENNQESSHWENTTVDMLRVMSIHMPAHVDLATKGLIIEMISYSNRHMKKMFTDQSLITGVLKDKFKFQGIIWDREGLNVITPPTHKNYTYSVHTRAQASIDKLLTPSPHLKNDESKDGRKQEELMTRIKGLCKDIKDVLGSTDVTETEVGEALSEQRFDDGDLLVWFDMYEHMEQHFVVCFIGDSPGNIHHKGRQFMEVVRRRPYNIVPIREFRRRPQLVFNTLLGQEDSAQVEDNFFLVLFAKTTGYR